jgi:hypothetical protein
MTSETIKAAMATGRERTKMKGINADFLIRQAGITLRARTYRHSIPSAD